MKKSITASNLTLDLYLDYVRPAARAAGILEEVPTEREETTPAPTYTYSMSAKAYAVQATGKLLRVERNKLNPITGGNFVSIAYYQTADRELIGVLL